MLREELRLTSQMICFSQKKSQFVILITYYRMTSMISLAFLVIILKDFKCKEYTIKTSKTEKHWLMLLNVL